MISITGIFTGLTTAKLVRFIDSTSTSLNKIVSKVWVHEEHRDSYGRPGDSCIIDNKELHVRDLNEVGEKYNLRWNIALVESEFLLLDFLDYRGNQAEIETRLAERVFIHNNTI